MLGTEDRRIFPVEVAGDLGGDEELRMERWSGCGADYDVGQGLKPLLPCCVFFH